MSLHCGHSKVRIWKPKRPGAILVSVVAVLQIGHRGRKWNDIFARLYQAGALQNSQSPGRRRYRADDAVTMPHRNGSPLFNIEHFTKKLTIGALAFSTSVFRSFRELDPFACNFKPRFLIERGDRPFSVLPGFLGLLSEPCGLFGHTQV
jgi:hypothetical protein